MEVELALTSGDFLKFDGKAENSAIFPMRLENVKQRIICSKASESLALRHVQKCLAGDALNTYLIASADCKTWVSMLQILEQRYTDKFRDKKLAGRLFMRNQDIGESVRDYALSLQSLCRVLPTALLLSRFKDGLRDNKYREMALLEGESFDNFLARITTKEEARSLIATDRIFHVDRSYAQNRVPQGYGLKRCYACNEIGHIRVNCPSYGYNRNYNSQMRAVYDQGLIPSEEQKSPHSDDVRKGDMCAVFEAPKSEIAFVKPLVRSNNIKPDIFVEGVAVKWDNKLMDSGASANLVSESLLKSIAHVDIKPCSRVLKSITGTPIVCKGLCSLQVMIPV